MMRTIWTCEHGLYATARLLNERNPGCLEIISKPFFEQANHGACLAHILRELQGLLEQGSAWAGVMHAFLWHLYEQAQPLPGEAAAAARNRYRQIVSEAELAEPPPEQKAGRGRPKSTAGRNLLRRLKEHEEAVLAFALVEGVPFTNNQAERDLQSNRK